MVDAEAKELALELLKVADVLEKSNLAGEIRSIARETREAAIDLIRFHEPKFKLKPGVKKTDVVKRMRERQERGATKRIENRARSWQQF